MEMKKILHEVLKGMCPYMTCGVPVVYWKLARKLTKEVYGDRGVKLLEKYKHTYDDSIEYDRVNTVYSIQGWDDPNTEVLPPELIKKLESLVPKASPVKNDWSWESQM